jgi:hypothetical protein
MLVLLALVGVGLVAIGALVLLRFPESPGGNVRLLGLEVSSIGAGLPLIGLGVFAIVLAGVQPTTAGQPVGGGSAATPSTAQPPPPATPKTVPSPSRSEPVPTPTRSRFVMIATPPRNLVPHCWLFHGNARLDAGQTLVVGARRVNPPAEKTYFQAATWTGAVGKSRWRAPRYFGTQVGQTFRVFVIAITSKALDHILDAHKSAGLTWEDSKLPRAGAEILQRRDVRQIPGIGKCRRSRPGSRDPQPA